MVRTSAMLGTFPILEGPSPMMAAAMSFRQEFFAPLARTAPSRRLPPLITNFSNQTPRVINSYTSVSYTHLRAHETRHDLVCRLLLEKKKKKKTKIQQTYHRSTSITKKKKTPTEI